MTICHRLLLLLTILGLTWPATATLLVPQSPADLGRASELVVRGEVAEVRSFWNASRTKILTEVEVVVEESYKGQATTVRVLQLGGEVDNVRMTVSGALAWTPGEEVLLFLERGASDRFRVAGFSQGKFQVEYDRVLRRHYVRRPAVEGAEFLAKPGAPQPRHELRMSLTDLLADANLQNEGR